MIQLDLCDTVLNKLKELKLDFTNIRGQSYDNAANMKGQKNGLQKLLLDMNPRAFYVPCAAHSLNLVINDAAKVNSYTLVYFKKIYI